MPRNFFTRTFISKIAVKINLRIITKNHAADPDIRFLTKSISKPKGYVMAHADSVGVNRYKNEIN